MKLTVSVDAAADPASTWAVVTDVTSWPRWTASMTSVERLDDGPLRVGSRARVKQPGMSALVWEVTAVTEGAEFTWANTSPGVRTVARHRVTPTPSGATRITLELDQTGPLAGLVGLLTGRRTRRFLDQEAAGLKAASESHAPESGAAAG